MRIRETTIDDIPAFYEIRKALFPWQVATLAAQESWFLTVPAAGKPLRLSAEVDGTVVGFSGGGLNTTTSEEGAAWFSLSVLPEFQGQGIGSALLAQIEDHLRANGARRTQTWGLDGDAVQRFGERHGFVRGASLRYSFVDTSNLPPMPPVPEGITFQTIGEVGPDVLYDLDTEATQDEPNDIPFESMPKDEWLQRFWHSPDMSHEVSIVVLVDGVAAAATFVEVNPETGRAWASGTGTLRAYRGRGLAKLAKSVSLRKAAALGVTHAYTSNDYSNVPMLAINDWLGYQVMATQWSYLKDLSC